MTNLEKGLLVERRQRKGGVSGRIERAESSERGSVAKHHLQAT
jgi:hypothetical protein